MSGSGFKDFVAGQSLSAAEVDGYLMKQAVMHFATTGARDAAITAPEDGMTCWVLGTYDLLYEYDDTAAVWRVVVARGAGTPEGNVTARKGAIYQRTDGAAGSCIYVKESDTTNTGWSGLATATTAVVVKGADESVTSSTALQDDNDLLFPVGAGETWTFEVALIVTGGAGDIKVAFTGPAGVTLLRWANVNGISNANDPTGSSPSIKYGVTAVSGTSNDYGLGTTAATYAMYLIKGVVVNGATAGNVTLQWAQNASSGTASTVAAGSHLTARRA